MQKHSILTKWFFFAVLVLFLSSNSYAAHKNEGLFHKKIPLYNAKKVKKKTDPYTLYIPIEITAPGQVNFDIKITSYTSKEIDRKNRASFQWFFVDSRFFDKKTPMEPSLFQEMVQSADQFSRHYNPVDYVFGDHIRLAVDTLKSSIKTILGKQKKKKPLPGYYHRGTAHIPLADSTGPATMHYAIDQDELNQTKGMYFLVLQNYNRKLAPEFEVKVSFPGTQYQVDDELMPKRDLGIRRLRLSGNKVYVSVQNYGEGKITDDIYERKGRNAFTLILLQNGKSWGGINLSGLDPEKKLVWPGGKAGYLFDLKIAETTEITAILKMPRFKDSNRKNNKRVKVFTINGEKKPVLQIK